MPKVLLVAYYFPPAGGQGSAGSQRSLKFAKYLPDHGWRPIVLTLAEGGYPAHIALDESLRARVPAGLEIHGTSIQRPIKRLLRWRRRMLDRLRPRHADSARSAAYQGDDRSEGRGRYQLLKDRITDVFEIPDQEIGWFLPAVARGCELVREQKIDAVWATGKPWTGLLIAAEISRRTGVPLVTDFRDPWTTNPYNLDVALLRASIERRLERSVIRRSSFVLCNTTQLCTEFRERYPEEDAERFVTLPNGLDPEEIVEAPFDSTSPQTDRSRFTLLHAGYFYLLRDPDTLLRGLRRAIDQGLDGRRIRFQQVGIVNLGYEVRDRVAELGLQANVEVLGQVPRDECLQLMRDADCLVLVDPGEVQVPSKLYEYCVVGRPILALSSDHGSTATFVREEGLGEVAALEDVDAIAEAIRRLYERWAADPDWYRIPSSALQRFDVRAPTERLAHLLDRALQ